MIMCGWHGAARVSRHSMAGTVFPRDIPLTALSGTIRPPQNAALTVVYVRGIKRLFQSALGLANGARCTSRAQLTSVEFRPRSLTYSVILTWDRSIGHVLDAHEWISTESAPRFSCHQGHASHRALAVSLRTGVPQNTTPRYRRPVCVRGCHIRSVRQSIESF